MKCIVRTCLLTSKSMFSLLFPILQFLLRSMISIYISMPLMCVVSCLAISTLVWGGKPDLQHCCCQDFWSIGSSSQSLYQVQCLTLCHPDSPARWLPNLNHRNYFPNHHQHGHLGLSIITLIEFIDSLNILVILPIMVSLISLVTTCHRGNQGPLGQLDQLSQGGDCLLHLGRHLRLPHLLLLHTGQVSKLKVCPH